MRGQLLRRRGRPHAIVAHIAAIHAVVSGVNGKVVTQLTAVLRGVGQRHYTVIGIPLQRLLPAVGHDHLGVGIDRLPHVGAGKHQDRLAALAAVEHLDVVIAARLLVPLDAVHRHRRIGITGYHAEQAAAAAHHPFTGNIPDERILGTQLRRRFTHPLLYRKLKIVRTACRAADVGHREDIVRHLCHILPQQGKGVVIVVSRVDRMITARIVARIAACVAARIAACVAAVVDIHGSNAGNFYLAGCQRYHHRQSQQQTENGVLFHRFLLPPRSTSTYRWSRSRRRRSGCCCRCRCRWKFSGGSQWCGYSGHTAPSD